MELRTAVRALTVLERDVLKRVTPEGMQKVMEDRGWTEIGTQPFPGDPDRVAFTNYGHKNANGKDRARCIPMVQVPMDPTSGDYAARVVDWAEDMATRHGDVAPAEVLAEVELPGA